MIKKTIVLFFIFASQFGVAQKNTIQLPFSNFELKYRSTTPILGVYIDKKNTIYLENKKIKLKDLGSALFEIKSKHTTDFSAIMNVHLYADKRCKYKIIDKVKSQISSARLHLLYRTNDFINVKKGIKWSLHGALEYIQPLNQNNSPSSDFFDIPGFIWYTQLEMDLYAKNFSKANLELEKRSSTYVEVLKNKFKIGNKCIKFSEIDKLINLYKNNEVLFIGFHKRAKYKDYIKAISAFKQAFNKIQRERLFPMNNALIEISNELKPILKKRNLILD